MPHQLVSNLISLGLMLWGSFIVSCIHSTHFRRLPVAQTGFEMLRKYDSIPNMSSVLCVTMCIQSGKLCNAVAMDSNNKSCLLLSDQSVNIADSWNNIDVEGWSIYRREIEHRELFVFRMSAGSGLSVHDTWMSAPPSILNTSSMEQIHDFSTPLESYYKHPILADWENMAFQQVIVTLYKGGDSVLNLRFNATGRTPTTWFCLENLVSSPWIDINSQPVNKFSHTFDVISFHRAFYINSYFGGCQHDVGWMVILDARDVCSWSNHPPFPAFRYAAGKTRQNWTSGNIESADDLVIHVRQ